MMKVVKISCYIIFGIVWLAFLAYLVLPAPSLQALPNSLQSKEPGDTIQIPNVSAYFTDFKRQEVLSFYQDQFSSSSFSKMPLITYRLNHPIQYGRQVIRDQILTTYIEELVHPLRENLYINGYEPTEAYKTKTVQTVPTNATDIIVDGKKFDSKVTLRYIQSPLWARLLVFMLITLWLVSFYFLIRKIIRWRQEL